MRKEHMFLKIESFKEIEQFQSILYLQHKASEKKSCKEIF